MRNEKLANFNDDCFDRKDFAKNLCNLIKRQEGYQSRVISIKADFGYGKTYFAKALKNMIDSQDPHISPSLYCHYIDIWKEDYNHKPLLALLSSLDEFVGKIDIISSKQKQKLGEALKIFSIETAKEVMSYIPLTKGISKAIESFCSDEKSIFKDLNALKNIAKLVQEAFAEFGNAKMIIIIDEIDRCHPEYAIEFLETLKHFFDLENLYFILMMNENHLREKVKSKFGYIDFDMWKDKFINLEFELPNARSQEKFLRYLICEKYEIQNKDLTLNTKSEFKSLQGREDFALALTEEQELDLTKYLFNLLASLDCKPNNRQLESICFHLRIALNILGDKPIYPIVLLGNILKMYFSNLKLEKESEKQDQFWRCISLAHQSMLPQKSYIHVVGEIIRPEEMISKFPDELKKEVMDNVLAARFASQASKTQFEIDYENAIF